MSGSPITAGKVAATPLPATYVTASGLPRYHPVSQALHWLTAALVLAVLPLAWVAISLPPTPAKGSLFVLHKSVGLTILAIVVLRIVWRMVRPAPPDPQAPRLLTLIGRVNHYLLYAIFLDHADQRLPAERALRAATPRISGCSRFRAWRRTRRPRRSPSRSTSSGSGSSTPWSCCMSPARYGTC